MNRDGLLQPIFGTLTYGAVCGGSCREAGEGETTVWKAGQE